MIDAMTNKTTVVTLQIGGQPVRHQDMYFPGIRSITENRVGDYEQQSYAVESESGNSYTVTYCGSGDGDPEYVALWECTCPAGEHGRRCKHVRAVTDLAELYD